MRIKIKSLTKNDKLFLYTIIVNVLIPKAGIKLAGIPITLGNILLLLSIMRYLITVFYTNKLKVRMIDIIVFSKNGLYD